MCGVGSLRVSCELDALPLQAAHCVGHSKTEITRGAAWGSVPGKLPGDRGPGVLVESCLTMS